MLNIELAAPITHRHLTVFPLVTPTEVHLPFALLVDALEAGTLEVTEVGEGTVPSLLVINDSDADVLILDGEQLIGARQNRMTNRSIIVPAHGKLEIPVSCMEQGRWHFVSEKFAPSPQHSPSSVRRKVREVEAERAAAGAPPPQHVLAEAQIGVWSSIAEQASTLGGHSATGALDDVFRARESDIDTAASRFPLRPLQLGLLAFVGAHPIGMDVIGGTNLYARLHDRLLRGYVIDGFSAPAAGEATVEAAQEYLDRVGRASRVAAPSVGRGSYRVVSGEVIGGELTDDGRVVHLSAFPERDGRKRKGDTDPARGPAVAPPSRRRWRR
jgi:hypothetical protein